MKYFLVFNNAKIDYRRSKYYFLQSATQSCIFVSKL